MIVGIGTDLCDTGRIAQLWRATEMRLRKDSRRRWWLVYSDRGKRTPERALRYLGTRFAAKEAFSKAIGWAWFIPWGGILANC